MSESSTWVPEMQTFGTRLWAVRMELKMNKSQFAETCGLVANSLGDWEAGTRFPNRLDDVVAKVASSTGVDRDWLMWGETGSDVRVSANRRELTFPGDERVLVGAND